MPATPSPAASRSDAVTLVIPGRNCAGTLEPCLAAVVPLLDDPASPLAEIIFIDDGSTDATAEVAAGFPSVRCLSGGGRGAGAARNLGWRRATTPLVWFVDSDCVAEPEALARLLPHLESPRVGGVSGSYTNRNPQSRLACVIHEEIVTRHERMPTEVNFLATFDVLYRRAALAEVGGFDERYLKGQDAELSFRVMAAGYTLHFEFESRVAHHHETRWWKYLRIQQQQGYWRVWLHLEHRGHSGGDSYSSLLDHLQPPLAMLVLASLVLLPFPWLRWVPALLALALLLCQLPMTRAIVRRTGRPADAAFALMSFVRAFFRGVGLSSGTLVYLVNPKLRVIDRGTTDAA